jgi:hypothetical protein
MELSYLLLTGSLSGLISVLAHSILATTVGWIRHPAVAAPPLQISEALLHMMCGIGLALLFWLSWGLAAVVQVPWWVRGLSFGGLCWLAIAVPSALSIALMRAVPTAASILLASRWGTTCVLTGLSCAWSWERAM